MAALKQTKQISSKLEVEIEKLRNFNKWEDLKVYATDLASKDTKYEFLTNFLLAESDIELYLYYNPIDSKSQSISSPKSDLLNAKNNFLTIISKNDEKYHLDASILLGKYFYTQKQYNKSLEILNSVTKSIENKKSFTRTTLSLRQKQLLGECYALKGLCLEHHQESSKEMIKSYDTAMEIACEYIKVLNEIIQTNTLSKSKKTLILKDDVSVLNDLLNPLLELSLEKSAYLNIKHSSGSVEEGMKKFRDLLLSQNHNNTNYNNTDSGSIQLIANIRLNLISSYAQSLLCFIHKSNYVQLPSITNGKKDKQKVFKPNNYDEETLLCLSLAQHLSCKEVMLLRQPQYTQARHLSYEQALNSFDFLAIYLCFKKSYSLISDKIEGMMKFSFEKFHIWYQYGLSLVASKKYQKAYLVLKECHRLDSTNMNCILLLAKISLENLFLIDECMRWCDLALIASQQTSLKAFILKGCSLITQAHLQKQHNLKLKLYENALDMFKQAHLLDEYDYLPLYHLAHINSLLRQIDQALMFINKALKCQPDNKDCLHLLCLLLTSNKSYEEAYSVIQRACNQYDDYELLKTKAKLEELLYDSNRVLKTLVSMIFIYKKSMQSLDNVNHLSRNDSNSTSNIETVTISSFNDNGSSFANLETTFRLNEVIGKTITSLVQTDDKSRTIENLLCLVNILVEIGEFYLRTNRLVDAELCSNEIHQLQPMSHLNLYLKARLCQVTGDLKRARLLFTNALSINPNHLQSLENLSRILHEMRCFELSESMVREAIALNSSLPQLWSLLGDILQETNTNESMKCYETCIKLEATHPIVQFSSLIKIL